MPRLTDVPKSKNFEDRTGMSQYESYLRYLLTPYHQQEKAQQNENEGLQLGYQAQNPWSKDFGKYISQTMSKMSPDELKALHEGHFNLQDKNFLDILKKVGINDEMIDPKFRDMFYPPKQKYGNLGHAPY